MAYTAEQLRTLFQHKFNLNDWTQFLVNYIGAQTIRQVPEQLDLDPSEGKGYYLGQKTTTDNYEIGLFYVQTNSSVSNRRVGLRQIVKPYLRYLVDAALVVFDDGNTQIEIAPDVNHSNNGNSSSGDNGEGDSGTEGGTSGARGENDGDEDFDLDELDEEMPDFLVGEEVEKID